MKQFLTFWPFPDPKKCSKSPNSQHITGTLLFSGIAPRMVKILHRHRFEPENPKFGHLSTFHKIHHRHYNTLRSEFKVRFEQLAENGIERKWWSCDRWPAKIIIPVNKSSWPDSHSFHKKFDFRYRLRSQMASNIECLSCEGTLNTPHHIVSCHTGTTKWGKYQLMMIKKKSFCKWTIDLREMGFKMDPRSQSINLDCNLSNPITTIITSNHAIISNLRINFFSIENVFNLK